MKHNPGFLSADEIIERFVVRGAEFQSVLDVLREPLGPNNQHLLVIGRRGMGKTMLVNRVVAEVQHTPELAERWVPVVFGEEAYNVSTAGELWLEALFHVAEQTGERRWRDTHETLLDERDDVRLRNAALARLLDYADERGGRILLVVENLQDLLGVQMSEDEAWTLRHTLLNEPRIMLLATATNRFDDIEKPKKAAYELFRVLELERLTTDECRDVWQQLTAENLEGLAIRPVEIFTGGNLRLVTVLAQFAKGRSFSNFTRELLSLLDDHSDYFKSNIEALPLDERRAFTALCDHWEPALARDVARLARFDVNKTSMLLGRLERRGAIEIVGKEGRAKRYEVSERLYNLYHLVRRRGARDARVVGLVEFMIRYYGERLEQAAQWIAAEACELDEGRRRDNVLALSRVIELSGTQFGRRIAELIPEQFWRLPEVAAQPVLVDMRADAERRFLASFVAQKIQRWDLDSTYISTSGLRPEINRFLDAEISAGELGDAIERYFGTNSMVVVAHVAETVVRRAPERLGLLLTMWATRADVGLHLGSMSILVFRLSGAALRTCMKTIVACDFPDSDTVAALGCTKLALEEKPDFELMLELDRLIRQKRGWSKMQGLHAIPLAVHAQDMDAALDIVRSEVNSLTATIIGISGVLRDALLELAARYPNDMFEIFSSRSKSNPFTVALAMELDRSFNAPREVVEVAKDVLEDIRARRGPQPL